MDAPTVHDVEMVKHTTEEREDRRPALAKIHSGCKKKHFEYSVASVDAWVSHHHQSALAPRENMLKHTVVEQFSQRSTLVRSPPIIHVSASTHSISSRGEAIRLCPVHRVEGLV